MLNIDQNGPLIFFANFEALWLRVSWFCHYMRHTQTKTVGLFQPWLQVEAKIATSARHSTILPNIPTIFPFPHLHAKIDISSSFYNLFTEGEINITSSWFLLSLSGFTGRFVGISSSSCFRLCLFLCTEVGVDISSSFFLLSLSGFIRQLSLTSPPAAFGFLSFSEQKLVLTSAPASFCSLSGYIYTATVIDISSSCFQLSLLMCTEAVVDIYSSFKTSCFQSNSPKQSPLVFFCATAESDISSCFSLRSHGIRNTYWHPFQLLFSTVNVKQKMEVEEQMPATDFVLSRELNLIPLVLTVTPKGPCSKTHLSHWFPCWLSFDTMMLTMF